MPTLENPDPSTLSQGPSSAGRARPLVSVIVPTYNRADYLPRTLDSIQAQTLQDRELLVIDDGSNDGTADLIRARPEPIRYSWQENAGPAAARNRGLAEAQGQFVAFLDSDDLWEPTFLETMTDCLLHDAGCDIAFCRAIPIDDAGQLLRRRRSRRPCGGQITAALFASTFITTPSVLARRQAVVDAGGFNASLLTSEDYDLWLRLSLAHRFAFVDEALCRRRSHPGTQSRNGSPVLLVRKAQLLERFYQEHGRQARIPAHVAHRRLARVFWIAGRASRRAGKSAEARDLFRRSLAYQAFAPRAWFCYLRAALRAGGKSRLPTEIPAIHKQPPP